MYAIGKVSEGTILIRRDCGHIESVSQFNLSIGSPHTQAAQAMQAHSRAKHNAAPVKLFPKKFGVLAKW